MRVDRSVGGFGDPVSKDKIEPKKRSVPPEKPADAKPLSFVEQLQDVVLEESGGEVDFKKLISEVDDAGRELIGHQDDAHLKKYKGAVKNFLMAAVSRTYRLKVVEGKGPMPKLYVYIEKIETKLDELTRNVLAAHQNPLRILDRLEELRGLLLDLKM